MQFAVHRRRWVSLHGEHELHVCFSVAHAVSAATLSPSLTTVAWWLQTVLGERTPAHREDVPGIILAPVIKGAPPAIEHDEHLISSYFSNSSRADQVWILLIHCLKLHAWFEIILGGPWRFLEKKQNLNTTIPFCLSNNYCISKVVKKNLFKGCYWCHLCSIQGSQQKHGPRGGIHSKSWRKSFEIKTYLQRKTYCY